MWLKYSEIAPGNAMKFIDFIANGASGDMEIEIDQMFIILNYFYFQSPCEFHNVQIMAYLLRAWWCSSGGNIPTLFRKAWRRLAESWAGKFEPERRRDSLALLETHRNYEVRPSTSFNVQVLGTPIISDNT